MSAMTCDLCGGALRMGSGGIAACSNCGMEHAPERLQEKAQSVTGTVQVDSSHLSDNFLNMARGAIEAGNYAEAEGYCNRILETNTNSPDAWWIKGEAAGWQSTLMNPRISESATCISRALELSDDDSDLIEQAEALYANMGAAYLRLRMNHFARSVSWDSQAEVLEDIGTVQMGVSRIGQGRDIDLDPMWSAIALVVTDGCVEAFNRCMQSFNNLDTPGDSWRLELFAEAQIVEGVLAAAQKLSDTDYDTDAKIGGHLVAIWQNVRSAQAYELTQNNWDWGSSWKPFGWSKANLNLINAGIQRGRSLQDESNNKSRDAKAQHRFDEYWLENAEMKEQLTAEAASLQERDRELKETLASDSGAQELAGLQQQIGDLDKEISQLGLTKRKEKKALQEQKSSIEATLRAKTEEYAPRLGALRDEIASAAARVAEIQKTLTAPR